jgi:hypothetical protein
MQPAQAAMIDGTFPVSAWATGHGTAHRGMAGRVQGCPTLVIGGAEDRDARRIYSAGDVRWAGIIADKEIQFTHQSSKSSQRRFSYQVLHRRLHALYDALYGLLFAGASRKKDLGIETAGELIGDRGKVGRGPAARR